MQIYRVSPFSHTTNVRDIDITEEQLQRWKDGEMIQSVAPHLSADDREFILSGILPEEFDAITLPEDAKVF